jgi:hypothetical protein
MALGVAFIVLLLAMLWRRRMRKRRALITAEFAQSKGLRHNLGWRWKLIRFGERLFGHRSSAKRLRQMEAEERRLRELRAMEEAGNGYGQGNDMDKPFLYPPHSLSRKEPSSHSRSPSRERSYVDRNRRPHTHSRSGSYATAAELDHHTLSDTSFYTKYTGEPRRMADPRQAVKEVGVPHAHITSDNSRVGAGYASSLSSSDSGSSRTRRLKRVPVPGASNFRPPTPAEEYAMSVMDRDGRGGVGRHDEVWLKPTHTGSSSSSRNPFRR